ncbi:hypothetical protein [Sphingobium bisphenolivorans]|uniref:hypothetical protein n=1 Tax=Sphingobium bisphenolivorans TaxID=1335760 RepID=UPI001EE736A4|nr:hypothetical protein [Sphingobium bisphenolivorans]
MKTRYALLLLPLLAAAACSQNERNDQNAAVNGAAINRMDDAPGNGMSAPVPVSGSGETPPNAPAASNAAAEIQGGNNSAAP